MTQPRTIVRSIATAAALSIGIIGLPATASENSAASRFVSGVMTAPMVTGTGTAAVGSPDAAADRFVSTVMARPAGSIPAPVATASGSSDATEVFVRRVLIRG